MGPNYTQLDYEQLLELKEFLWMSLIETSCEEKEEVLWGHLVDVNMELNRRTV